MPLDGWLWSVGGFSAVQHAHRGEVVEAKTRRRDATLVPSINKHPNIIDDHDDRLAAHHMLSRSIGQLTSCTVDLGQKYYRYQHCVLPLSAQYDTGYHRASTATE